MPQLPPPKRRRTSATIETAMVQMGEELQSLRLERDRDFKGFLAYTTHQDNIPTDQWPRGKSARYMELITRIDKLKWKLEALQWAQGRRRSP